MESDNLSRVHTDLHLADILCNYTVNVFDLFRSTLRNIATKIATPELAQAKERHLVHWQ